MSQSKTERPIPPIFLNTFAILSRDDYRDDWRSVVKDLSSEIYDAVTGSTGIPLGEHQTDFEASLNDYLYKAVEFGALFGFALARTWPDSLEKLADWPAQALAYAGIDVPAEGQS